MTIATRSPQARLARSVPFWLLVVGSAATLATGLALTVPNIDTMTAALLDQTATGVEVYSGQAWVTLGAALAGAGALGLALALAVAAAASLAPRALAAEDAGAAEYAEHDHEVAADAEPIVTEPADAPAPRA